MTIITRIIIYNNHMFKNVVCGMSAKFRTHWKNAGDILNIDQGKTQKWMWIVSNSETTLMCKTDGGWFTSLVILFNTKI